MDSASLCSVAGRYDNPIYFTGPKGYVLGFLNVYEFGLGIPPCTVCEHQHLKLETQLLHVLRGIGKIVFLVIDLDAGNRGLFIF
jgi:hypothetical protein